MRNNNGNGEIMQQGTCPICKDGKTYKNVSWHLGMAHKKEIMEKFGGEEETEEQNSPTPSDNPIRVIANRPSTLQQVMVDAAKQMLDWKIIMMMAESKQNGTVRDIAELSNAINPPQRTSITEMKEMFRMFQEMQPEEEEEEEGELPYVETPNEWLNVAQQVLPMVKNYLDKKKGVDTNVRNGNTGTEDISGNADKIINSNTDRVENTKPTGD